MPEPSSSTRSQVHDGSVDRSEAEAPPSLIFEVPQVRWPAEGTLTLVRDLSVREGQAVTMTDRDGKATVYRVTKVVPPADDDPDPRWTVSVVEWE